MMRRLRKARGKGFVCVENVKRMGALHPSPLGERACEFARDEHGKRKKVFRAYRFQKVRIVIIREMLFVFLI